MSLGITAEGFFNLRVIPFDENYPGVETHANLLSNLLTEFAKTKGSRTTYPGFLRTSENEPITMVLLGVVLVFLFSHLDSVSGLLTVGATGAIVYESIIIISFGVV